MAAPDLRGSFVEGRTETTLPSNAEWANIRPEFERLYIDKNATLTEAMQELRETHNFKATKQMFKRRIREWGIGKNLKQHDVERILAIGAEREAEGKATHFVLRGKKVDMRSVRNFQRRQKIRTSDAVAAYTSGHIEACPDLRALTPTHLTTPDRSYENALLAFGALFTGLVDSEYYQVHFGEIVMPPSVLRGEVSDVCSSVVASRSSGCISMITVRKLALLLESIIRSGDAWIHCRLVYTLWVISQAGHPEITQSLLKHLNGLAATCLDWSCAQYHFVKHYSSLETSRASKLAADIISLKADMVGGMRVESNADAFKLRALDYDVFWRRREQEAIVDAIRALDLLGRCNGILGPLAVETLTVLRAVLEDDVASGVESFPVNELVGYLADPSKLTFCEDAAVFSFDGQPLGLEAAAELACIYCYLGIHDAETWIFSRLLVHQRQTASGLRREYSLLVHISGCGHVSQNEHGRAWLLRKQEIEDIWEEEVEAAARCVTPK